MPKEKIVRAAGYTRRSDPRQEKNFSLEMQKSKIIAYCKENAAALTEDHLFLDKYTGRVWRERKGLQALLDAARRREFDILIVYKLDRLSRDHIDQIVIIEQLKYYGVTVMSLDPEEHADDDSLSGQIIRMVYAFQAEIERNKIIERCADGRQQRVDNGHILTGGSPLYGYEWVDGVENRDGHEFIVKKSAYVIKPDIVYTDEEGNEYTEGKIVIWIFELAEQGYSLRSIAYELTRRGIKTPKGKDIWPKTTVLWILRHPYYKGVVEVFKTQQIFTPGEGYKHSQRPKEQWQLMPAGLVPPLVSEALWNTVQRKLSTNKEHSPRKQRNPEETLMRGFVFCGYCGVKMSVCGGTENPRHPIRYYCRTVREQFKDRKKCTNGVIVVRLVDDPAWEEAVKVILDPEELHQQLAKRQTEDPNKEERETIDRLLFEIVPNIINLTKTIETMQPSPAQEILLERLNILAQQKLDLEDRRDQLTRRTIDWQEVEKSYEQFAHWCEHVRPQLADNSYTPTWREKRNAIEKIGITVKVFRTDHTPRLLVEKSPPEIMEVLCPGNSIPLTMSHIHLMVGARFTSPVQ